MTNDALMESVPEKEPVTEHISDLPVESDHTNADQTPCATDPTESSETTETSFSKGIPQNKCAPVEDVPAAVVNESEDTSNTQVCKSDNYIGFSYSTIGKKHIKTGMPCQDSSGHAVHDNYSVAVIADGHSDPLCLRSHIGSKIAVDTTLYVLGKKIDDKDIDSFYSDIESDEKDFFTALWKSILSEWRFRIRDYHSTHPLTDEEIQKNKDIAAKSYPEDVVEQKTKIIRHCNKTGDIYSFYGTTLRVGVMYEKGYFLLSIGDGTSVSVHKDGTAYQLLEPEKLSLGETHSVCDDNAMDFVHHFVSKEPAAALAVYCDGISLSTKDSEQEYLIKRKTKDIVRETITNLEWETELTNYLIECSQYDPNDDCSIGLIMSPGLDEKTFENPVSPLVWKDEPIEKHECKWGNFHFGDRRYSYIINAFDERGYKSMHGEYLLSDLLDVFVKEAPAKIRNADKTMRSDLFVKELRKVIQQWTRIVIEREDEHPDTEEELSQKLDNEIIFDHDFEKYAVSFALVLVVGKEYYAALIGKGTLHLIDKNRETALYYDDPESIATIDLDSIKTVSGTELLNAKIYNFSKKFESR